MYIIKASHMLDPDHDSSESGFLDVITMAITLFYSLVLMRIFVIVFRRLYRDLVLPIF